MFDWYYFHYENPVHGYFCYQAQKNVDQLEIMSNIEQLNKNITGILIIIYFIQISVMYHFNHFFF